MGDSQVVAQFALDALGGSTALNSQLSHKYDLKPRRNSLMGEFWAMHMVHEFPLLVEGLSFVWFTACTGYPLWMD